MHLLKNLPLPPRKKKQKNELETNGKVEFKVKITYITGTTKLINTNALFAVDLHRRNRKHAAAELNIHNGMKDLYEANYRTNLLLSYSGTGRFSRKREIGRAHV